MFATFRVSGGDGPEVYTDVLTKNMTPYVTTQVVILRNIMIIYTNVLQHWVG